MTSTEVEQTVKEMVRRIVARFEPDRIVLFGSHARGQAGPDSDVDLLVVMPVQGSKRAQQVRIRLELRGLGVAKDVVVVTPEEADRLKEIPGTIVRPAFREGKVVYERRV
jgi:uncharacterized protein